MLPLSCNGIISTPTRPAWDSAVARLKHRGYMPMVSYFGQRSPPGKHQEGAASTWPASTRA